MDISQQPVVILKGEESSASLQRRRRSIAEKRRIVEETLIAGASVARAARAQGVNANQLGRNEGKSAPVARSPSSIVLPRFHNPKAVRFTSNCAMRRFALRATPTRYWCGSCWSACGDDLVAGQHADLDRSRRHRFAARLHRAECAGADEAGTESVLRACMCVSWTPGRSHQASLV